MVAEAAQKTLSALRWRGTGVYSLRGSCEFRGMQDLLRTNDPALLSYVEALLKEAEIEHFVADRHVSSVLGSINVMGYPAPRVLVAEEDVDRARKVLLEAGLEESLKRSR